MSLLKQVFVIDLTRGSAIAEGLRISGRLHYRSLESKPFVRTHSPTTSY